MKTAVTLLVLTIATVTAVAQGTVILDNQTGLVRQWTGFSDPTLISIPKDSGWVQLFAAPKGLPLHPLFSGGPGWQMLNYSSLSAFLAANPGWAGAVNTSGAVAVPIAVAAGIFNGGTFTIGNINEAANADYFLLGWTGPYTTADAAIAAYNLGQAMFGESGVVTTATGDPLATPPGTAVPLKITFPGMTIGVIPEPSFFALAGLGAAALKIFRRRREAFTAVARRNGPRRATYLSACRPRREAHSCTQRLRMGKTGSFLRRLVPLPLLLAPVTVLAEQETCSYSNIVSRLITPTNAVTFTDLRGHTYSNVTVKLTPYGLAWQAQPGSEGRLALTNLDNEVLAEITGLDTSQAAYLLYKNAVENIPHPPREATNSTPWWLDPCPAGLSERLMAIPQGKPRPTMGFPPMGGLYPWWYHNDARNDRWKREMKQQMEEAQRRMDRQLRKEVFQQLPSPAPPVRTKP